MERRSTGFSPLGVAMYVPAAKQTVKKGVALLLTNGSGKVEPDTDSSAEEKILTLPLEFWITTSGPFTLDKVPRNVPEKPSELVIVSPKVK
ncbi:MAG: hypothetical protein AAF724_02960 [Pseudomonadota bacterium]